MRLPQQLPLRDEVASPARQGRGKRRYRCRSGTYRPTLLRAMLYVVYSAPIGFSTRVGNGAPRGFIELPGTRVLRCSPGCANVVVGSGSALQPAPKHDVHAAW